MDWGFVYTVEEVNRGDKWQLLLVQSLSPNHNIGVGVLRKRMCSCRLMTDVELHYGL